MFEVISHMGKNLNFTFSVVEAPPGEAWGSIQGDGRWNGMMRLIIENPVSFVRSIPPSPIFQYLIALCYFVCMHGIMMMGL